MEFGRLTVQELDKVDFSLPQDPAANKLVLKTAGKKPSVYIGSTRWGSREWIGKVYPAGTKEAQFLDMYVRHYNAVELNATHYKIYKPGEIAKWAAKAAGRDFKFCPKVPNSISHYSGFNNADTLTTAFLEGMLAFGENLGPIFLQLSDRYSPEQRGKLFKYLASLPQVVQFFLELRHPRWFSDTTIRKELFDTLRQLNIGAVITDTAGRRDVTHMELTVSKTIVRFGGNNLHITDYSRLDAWVHRIKYWLEQGLEEVYFFIHLQNEGESPDLTVYLIDKLNEACGLQLQKPVFIQPALF